MGKANEITAEFPEKLQFLFRPMRYKVAYGGRGGAKSWGFARALIIKGAERMLRILCARELQVSIADSVHQVLADQIYLLGLQRYYEIQEQGIYGINGTEFLFAGIRNNVTKVKSTEGIDICWVEEAEKVSDDSWKVLIPTIRKIGSEIWVSFNPDQSTDPTYKRFVVNPPPDSEVVKIGYQDNPWFPEVLERERAYLASVDQDAYQHIWEGNTREQSDAQVLKNKFVVEPFLPGGAGWDGPYQGADWGFAIDPTTLIRCWVRGFKLYIEHEAYGVGVDIDKTPELFDKKVPKGRDYATRADNARPETISYMQRNGYARMVGVDKWKGSVEDGVARLRAFEQIVIHPRCKHTIEEARLWSYKTDRLTGDVLPELIDKHNHCWDAVRYAIEPIIRRSALGLLDFYSQQKAADDARQTQEKTK